MRWFFDTEFNEDGKTIELISNGLVSELGHEYYAVSNEFDPEVLPRLGEAERAPAAPATHKSGLEVSSTDRV